MGRRLSRRVWYAVAALVPFPLLGLGYVAAFPGGPFTEYFAPLFSGKGSEHALSRKAQTPKPLASETAALFQTAEKGPRADRYVELRTTSTAGKKPGFVAASLAPASAGDIVGSIGSGGKSDRLQPLASDLALRGALDDYGVTPELFYGAPFKTTFRSPLEVYDGMVQNLVYKPEGSAKAFRHQDETEAEFQERQRRCLATAIYFEARGEPVRGQLAVAQVIMNRVRSPLFPDTICGVVYQGQHRRGCQFSFTCDGRSDTPRNDSSWALAQDLARQVTSGQVWLTEVGYSTFYHANYVSPRWSRAMNRIDTIGRHIFYKKRNEQPYVVEASAEPETPAYSLPTIAGTSPAKPATMSTPAVATADTASSSSILSFVSSSDSYASSLTPSLGFSLSE